MRHPVLFAVIIFLLLAIIGCGATVNTQPAWADDFVVPDIPDTTDPPDIPDPPGYPMEKLYGYWVTNSLAEEGFLFEVLFIIREDKTFSMVGALNGAIATLWEHGIYKFDQETLCLSFLTNGVTTWREVIFYGSHFYYLKLLFVKANKLPDWAESIPPNYYVSAEGGGLSLRRKSGKFRILL